MTRALRRRKGTNSRSRQQDREARDRDALVQDTAATFTCSFDTAKDFAYQCSRALDDLNTDVTFNRLAHEIWAGRPDHTPELTAALEDCLRERERHMAELRQLEKRFSAVAATNTHDHLDPVEDYRKLVRERIFPSSSTAPSE